MKTLIKACMAMYTVCCILYANGILSDAVQALIILPVFFALLAIPFGLLTNLFGPAASRTQHFTQNSDYTE